MRHFFRVVMLLGVVSLSPGVVRAQQPGREAAFKAKISADSARAVALRQVPRGTVQAAELKLERGLLVYIFDLAVPGRDGLEEVLVSAADGSVVAVRHLGGSAPKPAASRTRALDRIGEFDDD
jgi:hypothetical protein